MKVNCSVHSSFFASLNFALSAVYMLIIAGFTAVSASLGICMIAGFNPRHLLPGMPYWSGALFAFSLLALSIFMGICCLRVARSTRRRWVSIRMRHHRRSAAAGGKPLPAIAGKSAYPEIQRRKIQKIAILSFAAFGILLISGLLVCTLSAGELCFWRMWR